MPLRGTDLIFRGNPMTSPLLDKSKAFALEIIKVCNEIKRSKRESVLTNQLIRSGTSVAADVISFAAAIFLTEQSSAALKKKRQKQI